MEDKYNKESASFTDMMDLINKLLGPEGCEWDKAQTFMSMRRFILEESYELIEAITENNKAAIAEEAGDLLFQIGFQIALAARQGYFQEKEVFNAIITKLTKRHPHIFQHRQQIDKNEIESNWHRIKAKTKLRGDRQVLGEIPKMMPSLSTALLIQERASVFGFDWQKYENVLAKVSEEIDEIRNAKSTADQEEEFGDLLFSMVNVGRWIGINPELALGKANSKFMERVGKMADIAEASGSNLSDMDFAEMNDLWDKVKIESND